MYILRILKPLELPLHKSRLLLRYGLQRGYKGIELTLLLAMDIFLVRLMNGQKLWTSNRQSLAGTAFSATDRPRGKRHLVS